MRHDPVDMHRETIADLLQDGYDEESDFNAALDNASNVEVASLVPEQPPYSIPASKVLFLAERDLYDEELKAWREVDYRTVHKDALQLLIDYDQKAQLNDLSEAIRRRRIAPFVGAGMSAEAFPLWGAALEEIADRIDEVDTSHVKNLVKSGDFLKAAETLWLASETQVRNYVLTKFAKSEIPQGGMRGPIRLLPRLGDGCVITTNFDSVVEHVLGGKVVEAYMHGKQPGNKFVTRLIRGDRCLMKLHGDPETPDSFVFTRAQYDEGYGTPFDFSKPLPKALRQLFVSQSLLFLGCSLEKDKTLELFQHVLNDGQFDVPDHFAILVDPGDRVARERKETRLLKLKIRPIWYPPTRHEMVEELLTLAIDKAEKRIAAF